jgi:release factor glutamine methyltransferase
VPDQEAVQNMTTPGSRRPSSEPSGHRSVRSHIAAGRQALLDGGFRAEDAAMDAEVLARDLLGWDRAQLLVQAAEPSPPGFPDRFAALIARRLNREPVAMIAGHREFWGLDFTVTPSTLVPRPETELIVEEALRILPASAPCRILDVGTGTGCLAISLAVERPQARVVATDNSRAALLVARANAVRHHVQDRIAFVQTDLLAGIRGRADVIVSNPPYVPDAAAPALPPDVVRYEPAGALFGGADGLAIVRRLLAGASAHLDGNGRLIVEFGYGQEDSVREIAQRTGWTVDRILCDLQGIARTAVLRR